MTGFDSLTSDENGIIPKITSSLPPGTYYLSEVTPPFGYKKLAGDLVFTISPEGHVEIPDSVMHIGTVNFEPIREENANGEVTLKYNVTIHCSKGSYAENFARNRGIPCKAK